MDRPKIDIRGFIRKTEARVEREREQKLHAEMVAENLAKKLKKNTYDIGKLYFSIESGKAIYISNEQIKYTGLFQLKNNSYLLLKFLSQNPRKLFSAKELNNTLNKQRQHGNSTEDRRVRDSIKAIIKEMGTGEFLTTKKGWMLNCNVELT